MYTHTLKTDKPMLEAIKNGRKNFEIRKDDRAFQTGDLINFVEVTVGIPRPAQIPMTETPKPLLKVITFVLRGGQYGLEVGYVGLALKDVEKEGVK